MIKTLTSALIFFVYCIPAFAQQAGTLDSTYGTGGISITNVESQDDFEFVAVDSYDRIYISQAYQFKVTRLTPDGVVDSSYGINGTAYAADYDVISMLIQSDDKIILCGAENNQDFVLARLETNGGLDSSFGNGGLFINPDLFLEQLECRQAILSPDGSIYVVAEKELDLVVEKITSNGKLDSTYDDDGVVKKSLGIYDAQVNALQGDGKLLVGSLGSSYNIARFKTNGGLDNTFGTSGVVILNIPNPTTCDWGMISELIPQQDGKILVITNKLCDGSPFDYYVYITRLNQDGSIDSAFGTEGTTTYSYPTNQSKYGDVYQVKQQSDGRLFISYWIYAAGGAKKAVVTCFDTNGLPDVSFGNNGSFTYIAESYYIGELAGTAFQSDGSIICGFSYDNQGVNNANLYTLRLFNDLLPTTDGSAQFETGNWKFKGAMGQNIPNPFDNSTLIPLLVPKDCKDAYIVIAESSTGKTVRAISVACGETQLTIESGTLASGIYTYSLYVEGELVDTKQLVLAKESR